MLLLGPFAALLPFISAQATPSLDCGCTTMGPFVDPAAPMDPTGACRTTFSTSALGNRLVVTRVAGSVVMLDQTYPADVNAGFSPDSLCIVVNTLNQGTFGTQLYDLTGTTAKPLCEDYAVGGTQASTAFLPHGEWFVVQQVTGSGSAGLTVISTLDGSRVLNRSYTFSSPPGSPGDQ